MSRESAHRLRNRRDGALFAAIWDLALASPPRTASESHMPPFGDGQLMRLLGNHFRRKSGEFPASGRPAAARPEPQSDVTIVTLPEAGREEVAVPA